MITFSNVIHTQLIAKENNFAYTNYVFKFLDESDIQKYNSEYLMCTRFPSWDHRAIELFEEGYLEFKVNYAGDQYYSSSDSQSYCYKYNSVQFNKFVAKPANVDKNKELTI